MSSKVSLGNVFLFHMYLMVARMKINFSKVISERNGKLVFDGEFVEGAEVRSHAPSAFFL
jgi:hypothetical protein